MIVTRSGLRRVQRSRNILLLLPWLGFFWQLILSKTLSDSISAFLASSGAFLIFFDAFRPHRFYRYPLSTLVLLGFGVTLHLGPLLFTAFEGNSITFNLEVPVVTFGHSLLASITCILAHLFYRKMIIFNLLRRYVHGRIVQLKLFDALSYTDVLIMGSLGLAASVIGPLISDQQAIGNPLVKLIEGFRFFGAIPAAYLLQNLTQSCVNNSKKHKLEYIAWILWGVFSVGNIVVAIIRNTRITFISPLVCLILGISLYWLLGHFRIRIRNVIVLALIAALSLPVLTDLATAMTMLRNTPVKSPIALFEKTLQLMEDPDSLQRFRVQANEISLISDWSESYVSNIFLARFANAKFPDNSLENESRLSNDGRNQMFLYHFHRLISIFPAPFLRLFGVSTQIKEEAISASYGDKLYSIVSGNSLVLGGYRTSHFFGTGMSAFSFLYLPIFWFSIIIVFSLVDSHAISAYTTIGDSPVFSSVAITQLLNWFIMSNSQSVFDLLAYPLRNFIEPILLFSFVHYISRRLKLS